MMTSVFADAQPLKQGKQFFAALLRVRNADALEQRFPFCVNDRCFMITLSNVDSTVKQKATPLMFKVRHRQGFPLILTAIQPR